MILIKNVVIEDFENLEVNWFLYFISIVWLFGIYIEDCVNLIFIYWIYIIKGLVFIGVLFYLIWCLMIKYFFCLIICMCMCEGVEGMKGFCLDREVFEFVSFFVYLCRIFNLLGVVCKRM